MSFVTRDQAGGAFSADAVRYATDRLGNGAYFLPDSDGQGDDLTVVGNLTVDGTSALKGAVTVGTPSVAAATLLNGALTVNGATNLSGGGQVGSGFTVGGGLSVVTGNISAAAGVSTGLQATTCTTLAASTSVRTAGGIDVSGSILIGTQVGASPQSQIRLLAGAPQAWAPINPYLQIGDNVAGNAALRCSALRVNSLSTFSTQIVLQPQQNATNLGPVCPAAGTYMITITETTGVAPSTGTYIGNSAIVTVGLNPAQPGTFMVTGNLPVMTANGVIYTLAYGNFNNVEGIYMDIGNTSQPFTPNGTTMLITSTCLSIPVY